jgi:hypothetical protein
MSPIETDSPLDQLPSPPVIHRHMGRLHRELSLLRRLLRLSQAARDERTPEPADRQEVSR